ncbi:hypothetical protein [Bradyrhizobium sp. 192]|uniref:hypothetical protein n=1 Tax=Bradyrhizobium sp. 192 TaxID=2782660 RepID=UPI001FFEFDA4|nr:hypothetical protein [Bradyrhizobium sp. 192]UPJ56194.1 hypothetical protein IVB24_26685 [Bradyrhizobium sp. 192]
MRMILAVAAVLYSASAFAQADKPPMVGDKPLVQVKPKGTKEAAAKPAAVPKGKPQSIAARLQACLELDDGTKDRLNCYDAIIPPTPKPKPAKAKGYADCRFLKEEDERLACFNGFAESIPKLPKS